MFSKSTKLKIFAFALATSTVMQPAEAHALVISATLGALGGALASFGVFTPLLSFGTIGAVNAGFAAAAFLSSGIGSLLLSAGLTAAQYFLSQGKGGNAARQAPSIDAVRVNVRVAEAVRWMHIGRSRAGGAVVFAEFDANGHLWYLIVHGDSELISIERMYFDDRQITLDEDNDVETDEFCLDGDGNVYTGSGVKSQYFTVYTTTFTQNNPVPVAPAQFKAAFPQWSDDHKLAGTTYSAIKISAVAPENRYKIYRWRGPLGLGEPSFSIVGRWDRCFDPRDNTQQLNNKLTWKTTTNPALIWARFRTHPYGRGKALTSINWDRVAEQANICDQTVAGITGSQKRYECGVSIPESKERHVAESEILLTADAMPMTDSVGKYYPKVGYYEAPSLSLNRQNDIVGMSSREAVNGESETDGVIVRYIDPNFNYQAQPSSPWKNPIYYVEGRTPKYLTIDVLGCQNHNQAMRLAKAIGLRSQSTHRLAPTVGLRGLRARQERIVDIQYDETFSGDYEIATPVEVDENGIFTTFGCVPVDPNRWTLLAGEESSAPSPLTPIPSSGAPVLPSGVVVTSQPVPGSGGSAVRIEATFDLAPRPDFRYEFAVQLQGETAWRPMIVRMADQLAYSDTVPNGETHKVRWRTVTSSGRATEWTTPIDVSAVGDVTAPGPVTSVTKTGGVGQVSLGWNTPNSPNFYATKIYRNTTNNFGTSTLIRTEYGAPNTADTYVNSGLSAGTYYYWLAAVNGSNVASAEVATGSVTVT